MDWLKKVKKPSTRRDPGAAVNIEASDREGQCLLKKLNETHAETRRMALALALVVIAGRRYQAGMAAIEN
jgi:hypothetical protein